MACEFCSAELFVREERYLTREVGDPRTGGMTTMTVTCGKGECYVPVEAKYCPMCGCPKDGLAD